MNANPKFVSDRKFRVFIQRSSSSRSSSIFVFRLLLVFCIDFVLEAEEKGILYGALRQSHYSFLTRWASVPSWVCTGGSEERERSRGSARHWYHSSRCWEEIHSQAPRCKVSFCSPPFPLPFSFAPRLVCHNRRKKPLNLSPRNKLPNHVTGERPVVFHLQIVVKASKPTASSCILLWLEFWLYK